MDKQKSYILMVFAAASFLAFLVTLAVLISEKSNKKHSQAQSGLQTANFGSWKSPITSDVIAESGISISGDIDVDGKGVIYWAESRPSEGGRSVVCSYNPAEQKVVDWTPQGFNVRTRANEYGGGAFFVSEDGVLFFSNFVDQRLYRQTSPDVAPVPITADKPGYMYADGHYISSIKKIITVREDHTVVDTKNASESENAIVSIDPDTQEQSILVSGSDFYMSPVVSSDAKKLMWVQWNHPNMPWDSTEIYGADLDAHGTSVIEATKFSVADNSASSSSLPKFSPDGTMFFIDDRSDWWNLYKYEGKGKPAINVVPVSSEIGGAQWVFGIDGYAFGSKGTNEIIAFFENDLTAVNTVTLEKRTIPIHLADSSDPSVCSKLLRSSTIASSPDGAIYLVSGTPCIPTALYRIDPKSGKIEMIRSNAKVQIDDGYISTPRKIEFPTSDGHKAYGYLYLPKNKDFHAPEGTLPPLMVRAHGGPTASAGMGLNLKHQYLTSRGFVVLDVNYRGSTGYGRKYRDLLKLKWGIYDVEDVVHGAMQLVAVGLVDKNRLSIDGGSAGGFTTLAVLTFKSVFQAGISYYGISDLEALAIDTHKFESRYCDSLVGPYPASKDVYVERSPIHHTQKLNSSMAFFQGGDDKIVLPNQSEEMFQVVKKKGFKTAYILFPEEQHGFRDAKNIKTSIDGELYFLSKVFGFDATDIQVEMEIHNL